MAKKVPGHDFSFRNDKSPLCYELLREQAAVCSLFCSDDQVSGVRKVRHNRISESAYGETPNTYHLFLFWR